MEHELYTKLYDWKEKISQICIAKTWIDYQTESKYEESLRRSGCHENILMH